jgi:GNAT superfamily N-acetyltransferase
MSNQISKMINQTSPIIIRSHRPGDMGWVIMRHAETYNSEYGWSIAFEGFVAEICSAFLRDYDPVSEHCFIAELDGARVGCCFVVRETAEIAKLRMVLVDEAARGHGLGQRLVGEAVLFAKTCGYLRMTLWTNDILHAARAIYVKNGFQLVAEERHESFGQSLVGQNWELDLRA